METRIRELREYAGMSQTDLAGKVGIDQRTISNYETGKSTPDAIALSKFADVFQVSIDYILFRTDECDLPPASEKSKRILLIERIKQDLDKLKRF